jgi:hypothetical protein
MSRLISQVKFYSLLFFLSFFLPTSLLYEPDLYVHDCIA